MMVRFVEDQLKGEGESCNSLYIYASQLRAFRLERAHAPSFRVLSGCRFHRLVDDAKIRAIELFGPTVTLSTMLVCVVEDTRKAESADQSYDYSSSAVEGQANPGQWMT